MKFPIIYLGDISDEDITPLNTLLNDRSENRGNMFPDGFIPDEEQLKNVIVTTKGTYRAYEVSITLKIVDVKTDTVSEGIRTCQCEEHIDMVSKPPIPVDVTTLEDILDFILSVGFELPGVWDQNTLMVSAGTYEKVEIPSEESEIKSSANTYLFRPVYIGRVI